MLQSRPAPEFGPYNVLMCRPEKVVSFPLNASISHSGLVVAMGFYPTLGTPAQPIFSIRNTATNFVSLRVEYNRELAALNIMIDDGSIQTHLFKEDTYSQIPVVSGKIVFFG